MAVVGLGGLGHLAVKLAASMGADVTVLSTSPAKEADARRLGAHDFEVTTDRAAFKKLAGAIRSRHRHRLRAPRLQRVPGPAAPAAERWCWWALPPSPRRWRAFSLIMGGKRLAGSLIGGISRDPGDARLLRPARDRGSDVETIPIQQINEAYERMIKGDVRYRFVIDIASLKD